MHNSVIIKESANSFRGMVKQPVRERERDIYIKVSYDDLYKKNNL